MFNVLLCGVNVKYTIAYSIWNKADMLAWILDGIARHVEPKRCDTLFYFDACTDGSESAYGLMYQFFLLKRGFKTDNFSGNNEIYEVGSHLRLIERFMQSDSDVLIVLQDDQRLEWPILDSLDVLFKEHPIEMVGVIGGNAGFNEDYSDIVASAFSVTDIKNVGRLKTGQIAERLYLNSGPIVYTRKLIEKIGAPCGEFKAFYIWDELCMRARKASLKNFVMGMDITHIKFGRLTNSKLYEEGISAHDKALLCKKRAEYGL